MNSKYVDVTAIVQLIGCTFKNPGILDNTDAYHITEEDFVQPFHKIVFGSINNLHMNKSEKIDIQTVVDYLSVRPKAKAVFDQNKGEEYLVKAAESANLDTFNYYYQRVKKMSLLRAYDNVGMDVSFLYDPAEIIDTKKRQEQEEWLDNTPIVEIANTIDRKIDEIRIQYVDDEIGQGYQAADGMENLILSLEKSPEVGIPMYGRLINTVTRGARLGKFYLRSAATGVGKTRSMIADACYFACPRIYDKDFGMWVKNGLAQPTLYITTEQDKSEIQTMMIAFLAQVNEEHILNGRYDEGERERVFEAIKIFKESPIWIEELPDFSLQDVENKIKKHIREHGVKYVCHDYIHTSIKILEEITRRSGGVKLREDNILFMLSTRLKDICVKYGIFIMSATQLNGDYQEAETPDQNLLRGAKSIADKIDLGMILLGVKDKDLVSLDSILKTGQFQIPNIKLSIYKNRRGSYKGVYLWCAADLGTCRIQPMFCTNYAYELIGMEDAKIIVEEESAF